MKVYTKAEFHRQRAENAKSTQVNYNFQGFNEIRRTVCELNDHSYKLIEIPSGIKLTLSNETIYRNHNIIGKHHDFYALVSKFYLSGYHGVISPNTQNIASEYNERAGSNYLFYLPNIEEVEQFFTGIPLKKVTINFDICFFRSFFSKLDDVPQQLRPLIERDNAPNFHRPVGKVTPKMRSLIKQMWEHPYQGAIARMYLESRVLELLAIQLAQLAESDLYTDRSGLKPKSIDPIYEARNILSKRLENPPSILELAEQVGVCDRTLQRGFRKLFCTTVVGYLNQLRLEQAETLLRTGELSVAEVANKVGYSHLSHFAAAFKCQFGITPSECLKGKLEKQ